MHKFWAIAVGCALSVGMGVAQEEDTDRPEHISSGKSAFDYKLISVGGKMSSARDFPGDIDFGIENTPVTIRFFSEYSQRPYDNLSMQKQPELFDRFTGVTSWSERVDGYDRMMTHPINVPNIKYDVAFDGEWQRDFGPEARSIPEKFSWKKREQSHSKNDASTWETAGMEDWPQSFSIESRLDRSAKD